MEYLSFIILGIIFLAAFNRSITGFGESLIGMPLLTLLLPVQYALPLSIINSVLIATIILIQDNQRINFKAATRIVGWDFLGIPVGIYILVQVPSDIVKLVLGILVFIYASNSIFKYIKLNVSKYPVTLLEPIVGFFAGMLNATLGLGGTPVAMYGNMRKWPKEEFRATLQAFFFPSAIITIISLWYKDLMDFSKYTDITGNPIDIAVNFNGSILLFFFSFLVTVFAAVQLGRIIHNKINNEKFISMIYWFLMGIGLFMIYNILF